MIIPARAMRLTAVLCVLVTLTFSLETQAQKFEITPQYGYQVGAKWNYYGGYVKLKASDQCGVTANISLSDNLQGEFFWAQQNSTVSVKDVIFYPVEDEPEYNSTTSFSFGFSGGLCTSFQIMSESGYKVNCSSPCNGEAYMWGPEAEVSTPADLS